MPDTVSTAYVQTMYDRASAIAQACVTCGACFEACPMPAPAGIGTADPVAVTGGIVDLLNGGAGTPEAIRWALVCTSSGSCIPACKHGINPRFMVQLARGMAKRQAGEAVVREKARNAYTAMAKSARVLSRLSMPPETIARLMPGRAETARETPPDIVFYTGCNVPKTPHIVLLVLDILERIGIDYEVMGGTGNCCGVYQFREGDLRANGRISTSTIENLARHGSQTVLSWCPSCQIQIGEISLPSYAAMTGAMPFDMQPILKFLADHADTLRALMVNRVEKRVALHERPPVAGTMAAVKTLLSTVPGLELVDIEVPRVGAGASSLSVLPDFKRQLLAKEFAAVAAAGVETLATVYHSCHRELCTLGDGVSFEILNFLELIGEGLGIYREDLYRRLKMMADVDAMIDDTMSMIEAHKLDLDTVRSVLMAEFFAGP